MSDKSKYRNPLDIITEGRTLPAGYDSWGVKSVGFDGRTKHGYLWPAPGYVTERVELDPHDGSCPKREGDGLCVATTWKGMASGGYRAFCVLLVAYRSAEARGDEAGKLRVPQVFVVDRLDGEKLARESFSGSNLHAADLSGADLHGADLSGADLSGADLTGADLHGADLRGADLYGANLRNADLRNADLRNADLRNASLPDGWSDETVRERGGIR